jgi:hypothetical protein
MKAKALIEGASGQFGPEALKVIGQAFDEAWAQIACNFGGDPSIVESARLSLASIILAWISTDRDSPNTSGRPPPILQI